MKEIKANITSGRPMGLCMLGICMVISFNPVYGQSLQELADLAQEQNPKIQAYEFQYAQALEKTREASSLPATELGAGVFVSEPETRTGAQKARFSVRQMLPWFGTITAREQYSSALADAEYEELAVVRRELVMKIAQGYYALYANREMQQVLEEQIRLLNVYEQQALTGVEVGNVSMVEVLRLQIRQNELLEQQGILQQEDRALQASLNGWLNRSADTQISVTDRLQIPAEDPGMPTDSLAAHPELLRYERLYESVNRAEELNRKERAPQLGFGVDYVAVQERPNMDFSDNGKDILMPMVSLSIPLFNSGYSSRSLQNELKQKELYATKEERQNVLRTRLAETLAARNKARIRFETQRKNLKQAGKAEEVLIRNYETGTLDFNELLEIKELQLKFEIGTVEAVKAYFSESAIINYLTNNSSL